MAKRNIFHDMQAFKDEIERFHEECLIADEHLDDAINKGESSNDTFGFFKDFIGKTKQFYTTLQNITYNGCDFDNTNN